MRISDRSSDVCSSDLGDHARGDGLRAAHSSHGTGDQCCHAGSDWRIRASRDPSAGDACPDCGPDCDLRCPVRLRSQPSAQHVAKTMEFLDNLALGFSVALDPMNLVRSEEHTSELQSLMRNSYAAFCLKKKIYTQCKS